MSEVRALERRFDPADGVSLAGFLAKGDPADWEQWDWGRGAVVSESAAPAAEAAR
jgi:hypothetical protein